MIQILLHMGINITYTGNTTNIRVPKKSNNPVGLIADTVLDQKKHLNNKGPYVLDLSGISPKKFNESNLGSLCGALTNVEPSAIVVPAQAYDLVKNNISDGIYLFKK